MPDFPRAGGATAAEVAAAILIDPVTDKIDGSNIDAAVSLVKAKTDALPIDPADESELIAAIATRAPSGEYDAVLDASISSRAAASAYTTERAAKMDKIQDFLEEGSGTLMTDGTEQIIREYTGLGKLHCYIDLTNMVAGNSTTIRQYMKIKSGGTYGKYAQETYTDVQTLPLLHIVMKPGKWGVKVTLQQAAVVYKAYDWETLVDQAAA